MTGTNILKRAPRCRLTLTALACITLCVGIGFAGIGGAIAGLMNMEAMAFGIGLALAVCGAILIIVSGVLFIMDARATPQHYTFSRVKGDHPYSRQDASTSEFVQQAQYETPQPSAAASANLRSDDPPPYEQVKTTSTVHQYSQQTTGSVNYAATHKGGQSGLMV